jgi:hypothetical protein
VPKIAFRLQIAVSCDADPSFDTPQDPHDVPEIEQRLGDHLERVSYDAPIRDAEDIGATPLAAHRERQAVAHR